MPDGREVASGQGVFAIVAGRLAADIGRTGDADEGEEGFATRAPSQERGKMKVQRESATTELGRLIARRGVTNRSWPE